jgi:cellulose synthase operon protein YhjQ
MSDRGPLYDQSDTPEDVATLYSWANLHGAKYRDFSEARAQTREKARLRVQQAIEQEQARLQKQEQMERQADVQQIPEVILAEEPEVPQDWTAQIAAMKAAKQMQRWEPPRLEPEPEFTEHLERPEQPASKPLADRFAAFVMSKEPEPPAVQHTPPPPPPPPVQQPPAVQQPQVQMQAKPEVQPEPRTQPQLQPQSHIEQPPRVAPRPSWPGMEPVSAPVMHVQENRPHPASDWGRATRVPEARVPETCVPEVHIPEAHVPEPRIPEALIPEARVQEEQRETPGRPAWLTPERHEEPHHEVPPAQPRPADETLQGSRDRLASRWYALRGVFDGASTQPETAPMAPPARAPVVAVFSLAGGVGKTSIAATLGRALSGRGERVLLVDTAPYGLMPFFFGAHDQRPGMLRTFSPPGATGDAPIQMVTIDPETLGPETAAQEVLNAEISKHARGMSRIVVDLATASGATTRRVLRMSPLVLVPMTPDMNSVVSVSSIDSFFQHNAGLSSKPTMPFYVMSQFDSSLPLHLDIREILREQLGDRLLTFGIRRSPAVSEALAEGMTVMDYAPNSTVAEDFANLAGWVKSQSAPASSAYRGVRWSER